MKGLKHLARFGAVSALLWPSLLWAQENGNDPWESVNRPIYVFNDALDSYVLRPVAKGYTVITPDPVETGVSNFFSNLTEVRNILNDVLQWKWKQAANDTGRLLVNSTVGIGGILDVAKHMNLPKSEGEDFGQTLGAWGLGTGPYLVLPFFGPSNLRDGSGMPVDWYSDPSTYIDHVPTRNTERLLDIINTRAELLNAENFMSGDRYVFMREAYLQRRNYLVEDGEVEDDFGDFGDEEF